MSNASSVLISWSKIGVCSGLVSRSVSSSCSVQTLGAPIVAQVLS